MSKIGVTTKLRKQCQKIIGGIASTRCRPQWVFSVTLSAAIISFAVLDSEKLTAGEPLKIGILATLEGPFEPLGQDSVRGHHIAIAEFAGSAGGRKIETLIESTNGTREMVIEKARSLIDSGAQIIIGPSAGIEALPLRELAKSVPRITFINGASAVQNATLSEPAENFFRFNPDSLQWVAGLGTFAYETKSFRTVVTIARDYSFPHTQVMGFMLEFCALGGRVLDKHWISHGDNDFGDLATRIAETSPDALFLAIDSNVAKKFLEAYWMAGGRSNIIVSPTTLSGQLLEIAVAARPLLYGAISALPVSARDDNDAWISFLQEYRLQYPDAEITPSLFALAYYTNTKALLLALDVIDGDLGPRHVTLRSALAELRFESPLGGIVELDNNRHVIANTFIVELDEAPNGTLFHQVVQTVTGVTQTLGLSPDEFISLGPPNRNNPECP